MDSSVRRKSYPVTKNVNNEIQGKPKEGKYFVDTRRRESLPRYEQNVDHRRTSWETTGMLNARHEDERCWKNVRMVC